MLSNYTIYDIIFSEKEKKPYYFGTFEGTEDPDIDWPHQHDYSSLIYFTHGNGTNVIDFKEYDIKPNRMFIMIPGQIHNWSYSTNTKGYILLIDKFYYQIENYKTPYIDVPEHHQSLVKSIYQFQINEYNKKDGITEVSVRSSIPYINSIVTRIFEESRSDNVLIPNEIIKFREAIADNISENFAVETFADLLRITVDRLNSLCKTTLQVTAKQLIIDQKITEAKRMLYFTSLSIKEISYKLGFEDSSYFSRLFKNKADCTPIEFREKVPDLQKKVL